MEFQGTETELEEPVILVVDDNPTNLGAVVDYLEQYEFELITARSGDEGITLAEEIEPDLILLDVMMPGIDGFETCIRLKSSQFTHEIPIIFMTSLVGEEDKVRGFEVGAVDYVTKPIQQRELMSRVMAHLKIRQQAKQLQEQARQLRAQTEELTILNTNKDKFFSIVAHDLRGPFTPLLGTTRLLADRIEKSPPSKTKQLADSIHRSAQNAYSLLENLLHWSRLQLGRIDSEPEQLKLSYIAEQNIKLLQESAFEKNITLRNTIPDVVFVFADENMLHMVVRNLISNALKFTPPQGSVTVAAKPAPDMVEVNVIDTGVGISPENQAKLFKIDQTFSTRGTAQESGTGLGLILCQEMVTRNGGQIWVESVMGEGTAMKFTVPCHEATPQNWDQILVVAGEASGDTVEILAPSITEISKLLELVKLGDMSSVRQQAGQLEQANTDFKPFADKLRGLAATFDDQKISEWLEGYM